MQCHTVAAAHAEGRRRHADLKRPELRRLIDLTDRSRLATTVVDSRTASRSGDTSSRNQLGNRLPAGRAANLGPADPFVPTFGLIDSHCGYQMIMLVHPEQRENPYVQTPIAVRASLGDGRDHGV
jgi:hypothetical protein